MIMSRCMLRILGWTRVEFRLNLGWICVDFGLTLGWLWVEFGLNLGWTRVGFGLNKWTSWHISFFSRSVENLRIIPEIDFRLIVINGGVNPFIYSTQNQPSFNPKSTQNQPEINPKSTQNQPKINPRSTQNQPKINPSSTLVQPIILACSGS